MSQSLRPNLRIARLIEATEVEGPGLRAALWLQGCSIRCPGCCNPELFAARGGMAWDPQALAAHLLSLPVEGITLLGGEPLDQAEALHDLLQALSAAPERPGIMLFSGYRWEDLQALPLGPAILARCDLLVAGPFDAGLSPDSRRWIGSRNQSTHVLSERYAWLREAWPAHRRELEIHIRDGEIVLNGMPFDDPAWQLWSEAQHAGQAADRPRNDRQGAAP